MLFSPRPAVNTEYIEEGDEIEKTGKPKVKKEEKEPEKEQNQAEQPQDIQYN